MKTSPAPYIAVARISLPLPGILEVDGERRRQVAVSVDIRLECSDLLLCVRDRIGTGNESGAAAPLHWRSPSGPRRAGPEPCSLAVVALNEAASNKETLV